jgi:hypothetical protein
MPCTNQHCVNMNIAHTHSIEDCKKPKTSNHVLAPLAKAKATAVKAKAKTAKVEGKAAKAARAWAKARAKVRAKDTLLVLDSNYLCRRPPALQLLRPERPTTTWPTSHVTSATRRDTINLSALNGLLFDHHLLISTPGKKPRGWASYLIISKMQFLHPIHAAYGARIPLATALISPPHLIPTISRRSPPCLCSSFNIGSQLQT